MRVPLMHQDYARSQATGNLVVGYFGLTVGAPPIGHETGLENPQWGQDAGNMTIGTFLGEFGSSTSKSLPQFLQVTSSCISDYLSFRIPNVNQGTQSTEAPA
jgi:hypothetical protein